MKRWQTLDLVAMKPEVELEEMTRRHAVAS